MAEMIEVESPDGTTIGAEVVGHGPPLLLVHGGTADRSRWAPLVPLLQDDFLLVMLDRRGRGASAREAAAYALDREGEDVQAVLAALGEPAGVFAHSYGATIVLNVLDRLPAPRGVVLYEPAFATPSHDPLPAQLLEDWRASLAAGRREEVLLSFYRNVLRFDDAAIAGLQALPIWQARLAAVHTLTREGDVAKAFVPRPSAPAFRCRFLTGDQTAPFLAAATEVAARAVANSELVRLPGQGHVAMDTAPELVASQLREVCLT